MGTRQKPIRTDAGIPSLAELQIILEFLKEWAAMKDWDIVVRYEALADDMGRANINTCYKQATILIDDTKEMIYKNDHPIRTLCHEFAHVWLWDIHEHKAYTRNESYTRLVERNIEDVGHVLYNRVLVANGIVV